MQQLLIILGVMQYAIAIILTTFYFIKKWGHPAH